jgi:hypothetical protein
MVIRSVMRLLTRFAARLVGQLVGRLAVRMISAANLINRMYDQRFEYGQAVLHAAGGTGKIHYQGASTDPRYATGQHGRGDLLPAGRTDRLSDAGDFVVE